MTEQQRTARQRVIAIDREFLRLRAEHLALRVTFLLQAESMTRVIEAIDRDRLGLAEQLRDLEGDEEIAAS